MKIRNKIGGIDLELPFWIAALFLLSRLNPIHSSESSLCLFRYLDLPCLGCGLGKSIAYLFRGDLIHSFLTHPLGLPAFLVLSARIVTLSHNLLNQIRAPQPKTLK